MTLSDKRPLIMGIINVTPDSFSGDGVMANKDYVSAAVDLAAHMVADGADILDIGGESSRPGSTPISADEEIQRVVPVITAIKKANPNIPIAIDTVKSRVAGAAIGAGASIVNDITAMKADAGMMDFVASYDVHVVLMHNRANPTAVTHDGNLGGQYEPGDYGEIIDDVASCLAERIAAAKAAGIPGDKIIADPGLGFGKPIA
jgi:dihydropteroate synthase